MATCQNCAFWTAMGHIASIASHAAELTPMGMCALKDGLHEQGAAHDCQLFLDKGEKKMKEYSRVEKVHAEKIINIQVTPCPFDRYADQHHIFTETHSIDVTPEWVILHQPKVGGYYVKYQDGSASYSSSHVFESNFAPSPDMQPITAAELPALWNGEERRHGERRARSTQPPGPGAVRHGTGEGVDIDAVHRQVK